MVRYPSATTQSIQDFYDQHEVTKKFYDTWLSRRREGDTDAMSRSKPRRPDDVRAPRRHQGTPTEHQ